MMDFETLRLLLPSDTTVMVFQLGDESETALYKGKLYDITDRVKSELDGRTVDYFYPETMELKPLPYLVVVLR